MSEGLFLIRQREVANGRIGLEDPGARPAPEPAPPNEHQFRRGAPFRRRPPAMPTPTTHNPHRDARPRGNRENGHHARDGTPQVRQCRGVLVLHRRPWDPPPEARRLPLYRPGAVRCWRCAVLALCRAGAVPCWRCAVLALCRAGALPCRRFAVLRSTAPALCHPGAVPPRRSAVPALCRAALCRAEALLPPGPCRSGTQASSHPAASAAGSALHRVSVLGTRSASRPVRPTGAVCPGGLPSGAGTQRAALRPAGVSSPAGVVPGRVPFRPRCGAVPTSWPGSR